MKRIALLTAILGLFLAALAALLHLSHPLGPAQGLTDLLAALGFLLLAAGLWLGFRRQPIRA